ncbi:piggyBac transposable element-derived protein 3-like isoform X1 [Periplaneta americana]|uniref:piggyBac transposable element-derived protein 3-like isoform X1 n=1 Tax=Periplaneta americana TaxID=6978 RepID=UPI0037E875BB
MSVQCNKYLSDKEIQEDLHNSWDQNFIVSDEDVSEVEDNIVEYNDTAPVSESEDDMNDSVADNDNINNTSVREYVAKSGRRYLSQPPRGRRRSTQNIIRERLGLRPEGNVTSILDSFSKFFTSDIIRIIVQYTDKEAQRKGINVTNETEIMSLIGIFILMAANDDTKLDYHDLWSERFGRPVYLATMSRNRFRELVKVIRFDDKDTREDHRKGDKFAPLREVFELMNETFLQYYCPGESVVIDEMLSLFRGRCPFKVFMKEKPGKYGVLIRILADCKERYVLRMEVYAGKTEDSTPESRHPKSIVKRLAMPLKGSGRNITTDRYYTSVELAEELYPDYGLTLVGTMQTKRKHIPEELKTTKNREVYSSKFAFTDLDTGNPPVTLVSYVTREKPKKSLYYCLHSIKTQL